jgi:hypothetical protein
MHLPVNGLLEEKNRISTREYSYFMAFLWPFKLFHLPLLMFYAVAFTMFKLVQGVGRFVEATSKKLVSRFAPQENKAHQQLSSQLRDIEQFGQTEMTAQVEKLEVRLKTAIANTQLLAVQINNWESVRNQAISRGMNAERFALQIKNLQQKQKEAQETETRLRETRTTLEKHWEELEFLIRVLREYENTNELTAKLDPDANMEQEITDTLNSAFSLMEASRKAYKLEGDYLMTQDGVDTETLIAQIDEGSQVVDNVRIGLDKIHTSAAPTRKRLSE